MLDLSATGNRSRLLSGLRPPRLRCNSRVCVMAPATPPHILFFSERGGRLASAALKLYRAENCACFNYKR
ncbi:hypothetical protein [Meleagrid alphaherpesvirus 1]|uniref:Uncharacterized protein HVT003 n=1 Tax=Meleagrid herpesvirus 1 TaxID=37108 RepID=Q9DH89_MEHV1|nr:hypothetical protein [Meleagrid alphaherpesvirus 1]AAG45824.1 hypothetical protein [Meleagrid alphaherpesvirus 1]